MRGAIILLHVFHFFPRSGYYETFAFDMKARTNNVSGQALERKRIWKKAKRRRGNFSCIIFTRDVSLSLVKNSINHVCDYNAYMSISQNFWVKNVRLMRAKIWNLRNFCRGFLPQFQKIFQNISNALMRSISFQTSVLIIFLYFHFTTKSISLLCTEWICQA